MGKRRSHVLLGTRRWRIAVLSWLVWMAMWAHVIVTAQTTTTTTASNQATAWLSSRTGGSLRFEWMIALEWTASNAVDDVAAFRVFKNAVQVGETNASTLSYSLYGLANNTKYSFQVKASFKSGSNATALESNIATESTANRSSPSQVEPPILTGVNGGFIQLTTQIPQDSGGASLKTLTAVVRSTVDFSVVTLTQPASQLNFTIYGVNARTAYLVAVYATNEGDLAGPASDFLQATTQALQPAGPCPPPTVLGVTGGSAILQINPPLDDGGARIQGYMVYLAFNGSSDFQEAVNTVGTASPGIVEIHRLPGAGDRPLLPDSRYDFKAIAVNNVDVCLVMPASLDPAASVTALTSGIAVPGAPPAPYLLSATGGQISVELVKPPNMNSSVLMGFSVMVNDTVSGFVAINDSAVYNINFLSADSAYTVQVAAVTNVGTTGWSSLTILNTTLPTVPSSPRYVSVVNVTASSVTVQWSLPLDSGGVAIKEYGVSVTSAGKTQRKTTPSTSIELTGLFAKSVYTVKVTAVNSLGKESSIAGKRGVTFETTVATPPSTPSGLALFSSTGGSIEVDWNVPANSGGMPLDDMIYNVTMLSMAPCFRFDSNEPCSLCTLVKLQSNEQYELAADGIGVCERPTIAICSDGTSNCCMTREGSTYGTGLQCSKPGKEQRHRLVVGSNTTLFQELNHSTTYYFGVQANNLVGSSAFSTIVGLQTQSQTPPSFPIRLRQTNRSGGSIKLTWDPPMDTGGSAITGYRVYRDYVLVTPQLVLPPFTDCGSLIASTQYIYGVTAVSGPSLAQEGVMATSVLSTGPLSAPLSPAVSLSKNAATWLNVTITPACDTGGVILPSYYYTVLDTTNGAIVRSSSQFACCSFLVDALAKSQAYTVSVYASNDVGASVHAEKIMQTTSGVPVSPLISLARANAYSLNLEVDKPVPMDYGISSYDVVAYANTTLIYSGTLACGFVGDQLQRECSRSFRIRSLVPVSEYSVGVRANGLYGSSEFSYREFETTDQSPGTFELLSLNTATVNGGIIVATVHRVGGTAGSASISLNITQPDNVLLHCDCTASGTTTTTTASIACNCGVHLTSSGVLSQPGKIQFEDGEEYKNVSISVWEDDYSIVQPLTIVISLVGPSNLLAPQKEVLLRIDQSQHAGFASFTRSTKQILENATFVKLNLVRLNGSSGALQFDVSTFDVTDTTVVTLPSKFYIPVQKTLAFADRQSYASFWVRIINNSYYEGVRSFGARLTNNNGDTSSNFSNSITTKKVFVVDDEDPSRMLPGVPSDTKVSHTTGGEIELKWQSPATNTDALLGGYLVRVAKNDQASYFSLYNVTQSLFTLSSLPPHSVYNVDVAAWNKFGLGVFTELLQARTTEPTTPSVPTNIQIDDVSSSAITVSWGKPQDSGGSAVTSYSVSIDSPFTDVAPPFGVIYAVAAGTEPSSSFTISDLNASTPYTVFIAALSAAFPLVRTTTNHTTTTHYATINVTTANGAAPSQPPAVTLLESPTAGSLSFQIRAPNDTGGLPITDYSLYLRKVADDSLQNQVGESFQVVCNGASPVVKGKPLTCITYKLLSSSTYEVFATLYNTCGSSPPGVRATFTTSISLGIPSSPANFTASKVTAGNIYLQWEAPLDLGGASDVLGYQVFQKFDLVSNESFIIYDGQDSTLRETVVKELVRNSVYAFYVAALNAASYCAETEELSQLLVVSTLPFSQLSPPASVFMASRTGGSMTIGWTPPEDLAGTPLLGYQVILLPDEDGGGDTTVLGDLDAGTTTYTHYGLTEKTSYQYMVYAKNIDGLGDPSTNLSVTTGASSTPSVVQNIKVLKAVGGRIILKWDPPLDTGGRAIVYYEVSRLGRAGSFITSTAVFVDFHGLSANTLYSYEIRAFNGLHLGFVNSFSVSTTDATLPQPLLFTSVEVFGGKLEVSWGAPEDIGGASSYEFLVTLQGDNDTEIDFIQSTDTNHTFKGLKANFQYFLVGKTVTFVGESDPIEYPVATGPPDLPGSPPEPTVSDIRGGSAVFSVTGPSYGGGASVTLALYNGSTRVHSFAFQETSWVMFGLTALTQYSFSVAAINSAGETHGLPLNFSTNFISVPGGVTEVVDIDVSYDQLLLAWEAAEDTGGDPDLQYQVTYFQCEEDGTQIDPTADPMVKYTSTISILLVDLNFSSFYSVFVTTVTTSGLSGTPSAPQVFGTEAPFPGRVIVESLQVLVAENALFVIVPVIRVDGSFGNVNYSFITQDETAVAGENYQLTEGVFTLATNVNDGEISIPIIDDTIYKLNTSFLVVVTDSETSLSTETQVVIMDNGDAGFLSFSSGDFEFLENLGEIVLPITRVGGTSPAATIQAFIASQDTGIAATAGGSRFTIVEPLLEFAEGVTAMNLRVQLTDDSEYQYLYDQANISFTIMDGGPLYGNNWFTIVTAMDDGDISPPKECTNLRLLAVSGGYMCLQWAPPADKGGTSVVLTYQVDFMLRNGDIALSTEVSTENETIYGLNASTTYEVTVLAINSAGAGPPSKASLLTTSLATHASAPQKMELLASASASVMLSWDPPVDDGGSQIVSYKIYSVLPSGVLMQFSRTFCVVPTICSVKGLAALTNYTIQVHASTFLVSDGELSVPLLVQTSNPDIPETPPIPMVINVTAGAFTVQMQDPLNIGGSAIQTYRLFLMEEGELEFTMINEDAARSYTAYRLKRKTSYQIKYQAKNLVGPSGDSPVRTVTTEERSLPSEPLNVMIVNVTGGAVQLTWEEPLDIGGRDITGYAIMIQSLTTGVNDIVGYDGKRINTREGTVYGLTASTTYNLYVIAFTEVSNCYQQSEWAHSGVVTVTTLPPTLPGTAPLLLLSRFTGGIIELVWTEPLDTGGVPITSYVLYSVSPAGSLRPLFIPGSANVLMYIDKNLTESTTYSYTVIASNSIGESPPSALLTQKTTPASPPSAPLNVRQLAYNTGGAVEIGWNRPIDSGGQPLKGYLIYRNGAVLPGELLATAESYVDRSNLVAGKSYEYSLRAFSTSSMGSEFSMIYTAKTTAATTPQKPVLLNATAVSSSIQATWAVDPDTGGIPIKIFEVQLLLNASVVGTYFGTATTYTFRSLVASTTYTLSIVSYNDIGASIKLVASLTTQPIALPAAPTAPLAVSIFGGNFTIELTPSVDNGGAPITSMTVFEKRLGTLVTLKLAAGAMTTRYTLYGVDRESDYFVTCSATNIQGEGPQSPSIAVRTAPVNAPGAILTPPVFIAATGTTLSLLWSRPKDTGGDQNLAFEMRAIDPSRPTLAPLVFPFVQQNGTARGLNYNTLYSVSVRSTNKAGAGPYGPAANFQTQPDAAGEFNLVNTSVSIYENQTQLSLQIVRTNGLSGRVAIVYRAVAVSAYPATIGSDFELVPGSKLTTNTMYFEDLQTQGVIVVHIINDAVYEAPDEQFAIQLVSAIGASSSAVAKIGSNHSTTVTIVDDVDAGYISFEKTAYNISESAQTAIIPIIREGGRSGRVTLTFTFGPGTATIDRDYRRVPGLFIMENGTTQAELKVPIINDRAFEFPDEFFFIQIQVVSGGAELRHSITQVTILDDGDTSVPGDAFPPVVLTKTGGAVTLALVLPAHNGSSKGLLTEYIVRLVSAINTTDLSIPPAKTVALGNLTALTTYLISVAAVNSIGIGSFSDQMTFTTDDMSIPGPITHVEMREKRGGRVKLSWYAPDDTGGVPITKYRVYLIGPLGLPQVVATNADPVQEAIVYGLNATTLYSFAVQAGNLALVPVFAGGWGSVSALFNFSTGDPTLAGSTNVYPDLTREPTGGSIPLRWDAPKDTGGVQIAGYNVYGRNATTPFLLLRRGENDPGLSGVASTLYANSWYQLFVLPRNGLPPVDLPGNISIISGSKVAQTTSDMSKILQAGAVISIVGTEVYFVVGNMSKATKSMLPLFTAHSTASITSKKARVIGQALSFMNASTTSAEIPGTPPVPTLMRATGGLFDLVLESPDDTGGIPVVDFKVLLNGVELDGDTLDKVSTRSGLKLATEIAIGNLEPLTNYTLQIVAVNSFSMCFFGQMAMSDAVNFTTTEVSQPGVPRTASLRETGAGITLSLIDPKDKGGHDIQRYQLYYMPNGSTSETWMLGYSGATHQAEIARLNYSTAYVFKLSVFNGYFESANSSEYTRKTTIISAPGACAEPTLVFATGGMLNVSWQPPADNGGSVITRYLIAIASDIDGSGRDSRLVTGLSYAFYGLASKSDYRVVIRAENVRGMGPESNPKTFTTIEGTAPVGLINVKVLTTSGGAAMIAFNAPLDLGGASPLAMVYQVFIDRENRLNLTYLELEGSQVQAQPTASTTTTIPTITSPGSRRLGELSSAPEHRRLVASPSYSGVIIGGLDPEALYNIQIRPLSGYGSGATTQVTPAVTTAATVPSKPLNLAGSAATGGSFTVTWELPADTGGSPLKEYDLYIATTSDAGPFALVCQDTITLCKVDLLAPETTYWFYAVVRNEVGDSPPSSTVSVQTSGVTPPSSPLNVHITVVGYDSVDCAWDTPEDLGGSTIATYDVVITDLDGVTSLTKSEVTTLTSVSSLTPSTSYSIVLIAYNAVGDASAPSFPLYFTTSASANSLPAPRIGCVSQTSVSLSWYPFRGASTYFVFRNSVTIYSGPTVNSVVDNVGLLPGTQYNYEMRAYFDGTLGTSSPKVTVATLVASVPASESRCEGGTGYISELNYQPNSDKTWRIAPQIPFNLLTLRFTKFDLECDHDQVEIRKDASNALVWKGGCLREGDFVLQSTEALTLRFTSDRSVSKTGVELQYDVSTQAITERIPPPGGNANMCSKRGWRQNDGSCKCSSGFAGEGCSSRIVCCSDPSRCHDTVCDLDPQQLVVVAGELGDDTFGTGELMDASESGTATKAVSSLSKALSLSVDGDTIFLYPGVYKGLVNRDLQVVAKKNITIRTMKGSFWTKIDCEQLGRAFDISASASLSVIGLTMQGCAAPEGGAIRVAGSQLDLKDVVIVDSTANQKGGALYGSQAVITMSDSVISSCSASTSGGGLYLVMSSLVLTYSNVSGCTAVDGGSIALVTANTVTGMDANLTKNVASTEGGAVSVNGDATIDGIALFLNNASMGGAVSIRNGRFQLANALVTTNFASSFGGGLAFLGQVDVTVLASSILTNRATASGGGIYLQGQGKIALAESFPPPGGGDDNPSADGGGGNLPAPVMMKATTLSGNAALSGAGIQIIDSIVSITGGQIQDGVAATTGGGLAITGSQVKLFEIAISSNTATTNGGGMAVESSRVECLGRVSIDSNSAAVGGGIWLINSGFVGNRFAVLDSNRASDKGGGLYLQGSVEVSDTNVTLETAVRGGGAYLSNADAVLTNVKFESCSASESGGGLFIMTSKVVSSGGTLITNGSAVISGGGVYVITSTISGQQTRIEKSTAVESGGGVFLEGGSSLSGIEIAECASKLGGGIAALSLVLEMKDLVVSSSKASAQGGGLYAKDCTITIQDTVFNSHASDNQGGGLMLEATRVSHKNLSVRDSFAIDGGGVYLINSGLLPLTDFDGLSHITGNQASASGGNVFSTAKSALQQLNISGGRAKYGGGIQGNAATGFIRKCLVASNNATSFGGGVHMNVASSVVFEGVSISENRANSGGGGLVIQNSRLTHNNLNITSNMAPKGGGVYASGTVAFREDDSNADSIPRCLIYDNYVTTPKDIGAGVYMKPGCEMTASSVEIYGGRAYTGGGVYIDGGQLTLSDSAVLSNFAETNGGGIFLDENSDMVLHACEVYDNIAYAVGGGIASSGSPKSGALNHVTMDDCLVYDNRAVYTGGGILISRTNLDGKNNEITNNLVRLESGGGLAALNEGDVEIINWDFIDNTVGSGDAVKGGSLSLDGGVNMVIANSNILSSPDATLVTNGGLIYVKNPETRLQIINSTLSDGQSFSGGLIYSIDATILIENCSLLNGWANEFGGGIFAQNSHLTIRDSTVTNNFAYYDGGGIFMRTGGSLEMESVVMHGNACQDRGGALFIAPGAGVTCALSNAKFTFNRNFGFGSAIFIGRKNSISIKTCELVNNGDANNEGGALYAIDAVVTIDDSLFDSNYAYKGAAIELSRGTVLKMNNATLRNNTADVWGGALYTSVRATAQLSDTIFENNHATEGGALYCVGSSSVSLRKVELRGNTALNFGGGASMRGGSQLSVDHVTFTLNQGYTGGGISLAENASLALANSTFTGNKAKDFGGALYVNTMTLTTDNLIKCSTSTFDANSAVAGADLYWVFSLSFSFFECADSSSPSGKLLASTSATSISAGWWPTVVTSGVSLGVTRPVNQSSPSQSPEDAAIEAAAANKDLTRQSDSVLWPTVVIRDYYGAIATRDNASLCAAKRIDDSIAQDSDSNDSFVFSPSNDMGVKGGYITFDGATVFAGSRVAPYIVGITCQLSSTLTRFVSVDILVDRCKTGYQNVDGLCIPCKKGYYSLDGVKCYLCPLGATCEQMDLTGTAVGVSAPIRVAGYYLWESRNSYLSSDCTNPSTWDTGDPCRTVNEPNITYRIQKCSKLANFDKFWNRKRIFACLSGKEYYPCDTHTACVEEQFSVSTPSMLSTQTQCLTGYRGVMCATCVEGFYKVSNGMCKPCSDPKDPAVARVAQLLATVPIALIVIALVLVFFYFSNASEKEIMKHANAAKKFQVYDVDVQSTDLVLAAKFFVQQRAHQLIVSIGDRVRRSTGRNHTTFLFQIVPRPTPMPAFRAEKFKILLGFFQIFGGFKKVYEIPWPNEMSRLMDVFSVADFNIVDTTGIECFFEKNYFKNYRLSLIVVLVLLAFAGLLLAWGMIRYRVKLSTLPRHCVKCGLPVFKLLKREPHTVARRSTLLFKLKIEHKRRKSHLQRRSFFARMKARVWTRTELFIDRICTWWKGTRAGKGVHRLVTLARLPASSSEHHPSCPTSHHIQSGDVLGMVVRSNLRLWRARIRLRLNYQSYQNKCIKLCFWILLLFYPELSQHVVGLFYCEEIGSDWYMSRDKSLLCYQGEWLYYVPMTLVLIALWVIGIPLLFWLILFLKRRSGVDEKLLLLDEPSNAQLKARLLSEMRQDITSRGLHIDEEKLQTFEKDLLAEHLYNKKLNEPSMIAQVGFIYYSYNSRFWWFEVWDLGRKLFLNCVISLLAKTGANRIIAGLLVFLIYLSVMLFYQPYKESSDSALAGVTQIQLFITLFCGLILKMGSLYLEPGVVSLLTNVTLISNIMTLLYAIFSIVYEKVDGVRKLRRRIREEHRKAIQKHVIKLWRKAYGFALTEVYLRDTTIRPMPVHVIMELARRDKLERELEALRVQLELTTTAMGSVDGTKSADQADVELRESAAE